MLWLKGGDENLNFFHGVISNTMRRNSLLDLNVNGIRIVIVMEVRQVTFNYFENHFKYVNLVKL